MFKKQIYHFFNFLINNLYFLLPLFLFLLLLARNPFSERNLIANFEPFPDTFHYISPIRCWLKGNGFSICREGSSLKPSVPPLYSYVLLPFYFITEDARVFYFGNVILAVISFWLLLNIFEQKKFAKVGQLFLLLLFVTSYSIYWFPSLAMAENLLIPLVLLSIRVLIVKKISVFKIILASFCVTAVYGTKYSALGLTGTLFILYLASFLNTPIKWAKKYKYLLLYICCVTLFFLFIDKFQILRSLLPIVKSWIFSESSPEVLEESWWLSPNFFIQNFKLYIMGIFGQAAPILWENQILFPKLLVFFALFTSPFSFLRKDSRFFLMCLWAMILVPIILLCFFYAPNFRYILYIIPIFLVILAINLQNIFLAGIPGSLKLGLVGFFVLACCGILLQRIPLVKHQVALNLKYTESPWWYISVKNTDEYFTLRSNAERTPVLITAVPVHLYDFYKTNPVKILPLSYDHDFSLHRKEIFGDYDYSSLINLYTLFVENGHDVYVNNYGLGNEAQRQADFKNIQENFTLDLVQSGCHGACNLWKLSLKKGKGQVTSFFWHD